VRHGTTTQPGTTATDTGVQRSRLPGRNRPHRDQNPRRACLLVAPGHLRRRTVVPGHRHRGQQCRSTAAAVSRPQPLPSYLHRVGAVIEHRLRLDRRDLLRRADRRQAGDHDHPAVAVGLAVEADGVLRAVVPGQFAARCRDPRSGDQRPGDAESDSDSVHQCFPRISGMIQRIHSRDITALLVTSWLSDTPSGRSRIRRIGVDR
jgi:hypothetical protein